MYFDRTHHSAVDPAAARARLVQKQQQFYTEMRAKYDEFLAVDKASAESQLRECLRQTFAARKSAGNPHQSEWDTEAFIDNMVALVTSGTLKEAVEAFKTVLERSPDVVQRDRFVQDFPHILCRWLATNVDQAKCGYFFDPALALLAQTNESKFVQGFKDELDAVRDIPFDAEYPNAHVDAFIEMAERYGINMYMRFVHDFYGDKQRKTKLQVECGQCWLRLYVEQHVPNTTTRLLDSFAVCAEDNMVATLPAALEALGCAARAPAEITVTWSSFTRPTTKRSVSAELDSNDADGGTVNGMPLCWNCNAAFEGRVKSVVLRALHGC